MKASYWVGGGGVLWGGEYSIQLEGRWSGGVGPLVTSLYFYR